MMPSFGHSATVADLPGSGRDGGRSATDGRRRWSICRHRVGVSWGQSGHRLAGRSDGGRCTTDAAAAGRGRRCSGGGSSTVYVNTRTVVDPPTRHADEMSAQRPPSGPIRGRSTTVSARPTNQPTNQPTTGRQPALVRSRSVISAHRVNANGPWIPPMPEQSPGKEWFPEPFRHYFREVLADRRAQLGG